MRNRIVLISLCGLLFCASAFMSSCRQRPAAAPSRTITLGVCDVFCTRTLSSCVAREGERQYEGLLSLLREKTGLDVRLAYYNSDALLLDAVAAGKCDGVICKAWTAMLAARRAGQTLDRLADVTMPGGRAGLEGVLFTRPDSPIRTLADLTGKSLAMGEDEAYEKSFAIRKLLAAAGARPGKVETIPTCLASALAVREGKVDAAVVSSYAFDFGSSDVKGSTGLRQLARSETIPFVTVAVFGKVPQSDRQRLRQGMQAVLAGRPPGDLGSARLIEPVPWQPAEPE